LLIIDEFKLQVYDHKSKSQILKVYFLKIVLPGKIVMTVKILKGGIMGRQND